MRIAYIITTCENYITTRYEFQKNSFLKYVDKRDIYVISSKTHEEKGILGWDETKDDYYSLVWKKYYFLKNVDLSGQYDWFFFMDDDTFVFPNRLETFLEPFSLSKNWYIGHEMVHVKDRWGIYMSGGAGYLISGNLYSFLRQHITRNSIFDLFLHLAEDICFSLWLRELEKMHICVIDSCSSSLFHTTTHSQIFSETKEDLAQELTKSITFHGFGEQNLLYRNVLDLECTLVLLVSDARYYPSTKETINMLRTNGEWQGNIGIITLDDFKLPEEDKIHLLEFKFPSIDKSTLMQKITAMGGFEGSDKRELLKPNQWEKLQVFDDFFKKWQRIVFLDAGMKIIHSIRPLLDLDFKNAFLAPQDEGHVKNKFKFFDDQLDKGDPAVFQKCVADFFEGDSVRLKVPYFLNCMWVMDTSILKTHVKKEEFVKIMNEYPLCRTNEMCVMNLLLHFRHHLWRPFPVFTSQGRRLFIWSTSNDPEVKVDDCHFIKY